MYHIDNNRQQLFAILTNWPSHVTQLSGGDAGSAGVQSQLRKRTWAQTTETVFRSAVNFIAEGEITFGKYSA